MLVKRVVDRAFKHPEQIERPWVGEGQDLREQHAGDAAGGSSQQ